MNSMNLIELGQITSDDRDSFRYLCNKSPTTQGSESNIVGEWRTQYKWNFGYNDEGTTQCTSIMMAVFTSPDVGGAVTGKWVQSGDTIRFETSKVVSDGTIKMNTMSGTMSATDGMTGSLSALSVDAAQ